MNHEIGGELQTIPRRQWLLGPDYLRLVILLTVAAAVHIWLVKHTAIPARDALAYAREALNLSNPNATVEDGQPRQRIEVIRDSV
ncbi:MAG TPA: hypothetical protein VLM40_23395, partial [Gemmata sp.]|nr:hypothetical protein [Gemmata sp.]